MAKCVVCGGHINEGGKDDVGICFMCETERVKGEVVIVEVGAFRRFTGRVLIVDNESIAKLVPEHTTETRLYLMPKKNFKQNIKALQGSKKES